MGRVGHLMLLLTFLIPSVLLESCRRDLGEHATRSWDDVALSRDGSLRAKAVDTGAGVTLVIESQEREWTLKTLASSGMPWHLEWGDDNVLWFSSVDLGTMYWMYDDGWRQYWISNVSRPELPKGVVDFNKEEMGL